MLSFKKERQFILGFNKAKLANCKMKFSNLKGNTQPVTNAKDFISLAKAERFCVLIVEMPCGTTASINFTKPQNKVLELLHTRSVHLEKHFAKYLDDIVFDQAFFMTTQAV